MTRLPSNAATETQPAASSATPAATLASNSAIAASNGVNCAMVGRATSTVRSVAITANSSGWAILDARRVALDHTSPSRNQNAYFLDGFDQEWNEVGERRVATYTNLPAGRYTMRVRGSNGDGVWSESEVAVDVTVVPPFW